MNSYLKQIVQTWRWKQDFVYTTSLSTIIIFILFQKQETFVAIGDEIMINATYVSREVVTCTLPDTEVYTITIVNNGLKSQESLIYITYDPFCYTCTTQGCTVKVRVPAWPGAKEWCSYLVNYIRYSLVYINLFSSRI